MHTFDPASRDYSNSEWNAERSGPRNTAYYISRWKDNRGKGPRNYQRRDSRIEEDVNERLLNDPWLDASEISVTVREGEVFLNGSVSDSWSRRQASFHAENVSGVQTVRNSLQTGATQKTDEDADFQGNEQTQLQSFRENLKGN